MKASWTKAGASGMRCVQGSQRRLHRGGELNRGLEEMRKLHRGRMLQVLPTGCIVGVAWHV